MMSAPRMEDGHIDFDRAFKLMIFTMNFNGSHPSIKRDLKWMWKAGLMHGSFSLIFVMLVYCTINIDLKRGDITQASANGVLCLVFIIATYKFCIMWYYQDKLKDIIKNINLDYDEARHLTEEENQIVLRFRKKGQEVNKRWFILLLITGSLFLIKSVGMIIYYIIVDKFRFVHLYIMTYPQAVEDIKDTWGMFILLYIVFLYFDLYATVMYMGFEPLGAVLMLHGCGQLEIARSRVIKLYQKNNTDVEIVDQLREMAKFLEKIFSFVDSIKASFMILYELTLKATAVLTPVTVYQIIQALKKGELRIEFITVTISALGLSTTPCYYSDMLMEAGKNLNQAIYQCGWEKRLHTKSRKLILLLLLRTSRSMAVRTLFLEVCMETLTDVYHMAYAIFNLLNAK